MFRKATHRTIFRHDPDLGHRFVPGLNARLPGELGWYYLRTNAAGFRCDLDLAAPQDGRPRIVFLGDSITAGDGCGNAERFSDRIGRDLDAQVFNLGLSGSGTDQQLLIFERHGRALAPDLVVWLVPAENILRIRLAARPALDRSGRKALVPKPFFTLEDGALRLHNVPVPRERPRQETAAVHPLIQAWADQPRRASRKRLVRLGAFRLLSLYRQHPRLGLLRHVFRQRIPGLRSALIRRSGFQPYPEYLQPETGSCALLRALLERFLAAAAPAPVLIVPGPSYFHFYDGVEPIYQPFFERFADAERQVHVMDLSTPLLGLPRATRRELVFAADKTHFTPAGHEVVARLIGEEIGRRQLLREPPAPRRSAPVLPVSAASPASAAPGTCILGLSCFYHNSAAALVRDGRIVAAAEEERFTRVKNDRRFPSLAANYCLEEAGIHATDLAAVVYYENPGLTLERLFHTLAATAPASEEAWMRALPLWARHRVFLPELIRDELGYGGPVLQNLHHRSHAASAFFPSPFERAAVVTVDSAGEWATAAIGAGHGGRLDLLQEMRFPHSLGLLYSALTQFLGFRVNLDEYKVMGLAPFGTPRFVDVLLDQVVDLKQDGSIELNLSHFSFLTGPAMAGESLAELLGGPARQPGGPITRRDRDLARSLQEVTERILLRMAEQAHRLTGERFLCLAGGVALNCVANGRLLRQGPFEDLWIQPAAGDAGGALGAALDAWHTWLGRERPTPAAGTGLQGPSCWGPAFTPEEVTSFLDTYGYPYHRLAGPERARRLAELLAAGNVLGHFTGRTEYGPRALGSRSILGDPRDPHLPAVLNRRIKGRESFRPFAPAVPAARAGHYFCLDRESPYMLLVAPVRNTRPLPREEPADGGDLVGLLCQPRSDIPAVTHVDGTARVQTVRPEDHRELHEILAELERLTGCAVLVNTSFNGRDEPIVCTPEDAYRCFMRCDLSHLVLGDCLLVKGEQPEPGDGFPDLPARSNGSAAPAAFEKRLRALYRSRFLPLAARLREQGELQVATAARGEPSTWRAVPAGAARSLCEIPPGLASPRPEERARGLLASWQPLAERAAVQRLLTDLLRLGQRHRLSTPQSESAPETIYTLF